jgi:uncharacterized LabA/DUF88 family protein
MRVALFIDEANVYFAQRTLGWTVDFSRVYKYFDEKFAMYNGFFFAPEPPETEDETRKKYQDLMLCGYTLRLKKLKEIRDIKGKVVAKKANLDIEMVVDMMVTMQNYDLAILFTGDSDFVRAVEFLRTNGKQIFVFSTKGHSSLELINAADKFFDLRDLREIFIKKENANENEPSKLRPDKKEQKNTKE